MGRFYEFYDEYAEEARRLLGLRMLGPGRGFRSRCGFPMRLQHTYLTRLMGLGRPVHVVREEGEWLGGVKVRRVAGRWVPLPGGGAGPAFSYAPAHTALLPPGPRRHDVATLLARRPTR